MPFGTRLDVEALFQIAKYSFSIKYEGRVVAEPEAKAPHTRY